MKMPSITPAQIVSVVGAAIGVAVAFGAPLSNAQSDQIMNLVTILAPALLGVDAALRVGRQAFIAKPKIDQGQDPVK